MTYVKFGVLLVRLLAWVMFEIQKREKMEAFKNEIKKSDIQFSQAGKQIDVFWTDASDDELREPDEFSREER